MITPKLYAWKGAKWIRKIEFLDGGQKASGKCRGYSNSASRGSTIDTRDD
jgi:DMSO/TMAO reductase YedYZ molybdopterin-dependent catalytic subunit